MKALFWVFVAIGCVYLFYTGAMSVWSYLEITGVVDEVVAERASSRGERSERVSRMREDIVKKVAASGINVDERAISVTDEGRNSIFRTPTRVHSGTIQSDQGCDSELTSYFWTPA